MSTICINGFVDQVLSTFSRTINRLRMNTSEKLELCYNSGYCIAQFVSKWFCLNFKDVGTGKVTILNLRDLAHT